MLETHAVKSNMVYLGYLKVMKAERNGLLAKLYQDGVQSNLTGSKIMESLAEKAIAEA